MSNAVAMIGELEHLRTFGDASLPGLIADKEPAAILAGRVGTGQPIS